MLDILSLDEMKSRTIELFNKTLPLALDRPKSMTDA